MYKPRGKRIFDLIVAVTGLIVLSPLFVVISIVLLFQHRGKPFFCQPRPGLNCQIFTLFKFRTFNVPDSSSHFSQPQEISVIGKFLRKTSLDEIPQLWNVVRGEMSIVGPRPLLVEYLALYNARQNLRHNVLPGLTGLAQINGRNLLNWEEKFEFDILYAQNQSLRMDIKILLHTFRIVIGAGGTSIPLKKFKGLQSILL
ncbi:MAG: sugar transferase [Dyadobacter sp.]|uniref:sugar transferase n=1 Tax=Dyadobacter sp. TaxID=1914288 RepID=UPI003267F035